MSTRPAPRSEAESKVPIVTSPTRMVIQNADLAVRVEKVETALNEAMRMAKSMGGFVESSNMAGAEGDNPTAVITMRVPSARFESAVERLTKLGERVGVPNITGVDVTKEYADLAGRVKVLHAEEDSYVTMLRGARRIGEILEIKDRLSTVRQEIQSLEEQRIALKDQAMLSTITARFEQKSKVGVPAKPEDWAGETWASAVNGLSAVGRFFGQVVIFLFVLSPVWLPPALLVAALSKMAARRA